VPLVGPDHDVTRLDDCVHTHSLCQHSSTASLVIEAISLVPIHADTNLGGGLALRYLNDGS